MGNKINVNKSRAVRSRARQLLFAKGNYMTLVFALVICMPPIFLAYITPRLASDYTYEWVTLAIMVLLEFLIGAPVMLGVVKAAVAVYKGRRAPLAEVFFAFESPEIYVKALLLAAIQLIKLVLELVPAVTVYSVIDSYPPLAPAPAVLRVPMALLGALVALTLVKAALSRFYGILFYAFEDEELNIGRAIASSWRSCKGRTLQTVKTRFSFLPLLIISALPLGIPLFLYTLPYMLCTYAYSMAHISDRDKPVTVDELTAAPEVACEPDGSEGSAPTDAVTEPTEEIIENGDTDNV